MLMFGNIKTVSETYKSPKFLSRWLLWIFKTSQIIRFAGTAVDSKINKSRTSKYQNTTLMKYNCSSNKFKSTYSVVF